MEWINRIKSVLLFGLILLFSVGCSKRESAIPSGNIIARIGDRQITVDEFIRRAEYAIRPNYCKQDNYIHHKIVLNSLIAEKLMAMEAGNENELLQNTEFCEYIKGRKEQAMRQYFYYDRAYNRVNPDTAELKSIYKLAGRTYTVQYLHLPDEITASRFCDLYSKQKIPFENLASEILQGADIPVRKIGFNDDLSDEYFNIFYNNALEKDQILSPVKIEDGSYLIMRVTGWTNELLMADNDVQQRWNNVQDKLKSVKANRIYIDLVSDIMKGKTLELNEGIFYQLATILAPFYMKSMNDKKEAFDRKFWGAEVEVNLDSARVDEMESIRNKRLFSVDDMDWTVEYFEHALLSHPLVFRKRHFSRAEFPEQLKYAIADLIRDQYINAAAYQAGYDKIPVVKSYTSMWQDNLVSIYWRNQVLKNAGYQEAFSQNYIKTINDYLNTYIDSLQSKYSEEIEINTDAFEKLNLTNIDLFVLQSGVPYPIVSPAFPILTTDDKLDYGKKMEVH